MQAQTCETIIYIPRTTGRWFMDYKACMEVYGLWEGNLLGGLIMKKLFISQPMKGKSDEDILAERQKAIKSAEAKIGEAVEVIDSFFQEAPVDAKPLWFLGKSLELLAGADVAYFAPGWEEARGCKIEHDAAVAYGLDIIYEE